MDASSAKEDLVKQLHTIHRQSIEHSHALRQQTNANMQRFIHELQQLDLDREHATQRTTEKIKQMNEKEMAILAQVKAERKAAQDKIERERQRVLQEQADLRRSEAEKKAAELQSKHDEQLQQRQAENERKSTASKAAEAQDLYGSLCQRHMLHYEAFKRELGSFEQGPTPAVSKQMKLELRMRIHKRIGQISKSLQQIEHISQDLTGILNESKGNPAVYCYCIHLICDKVIEQAEAQVASYQPSAYFIAMTLVRLFSRHEPLQTIFFGKIMTCCPFVLGSIPSFRASETRDDYLKRIGYVYKVSQSSLETTESWQDRMAGALALFSALIQTQSCSRSLYDPALGWMYLSRVLNSKPQAQTPLLLVTFLEMAGYGLFLVYRQSFQRLLVFMSQVYVPYLANQRSAGLAISVQALTRLELYLKQVLEAGRGTPFEPEGRAIK